MGRFRPPVAITTHRLFFIGAVLSVYAAVYYATDGLSFSPQKDELHFWPTSLGFSRSLIPSLEDLRSYAELNTPLPFLLFGWSEYLFHGGIAGGRLLNLALSFTIACVVVSSGASKHYTPLLAAVGLLLYPYYLGVSAHVYTDIIAALFVLLGTVAYVSRRSWLSAACFTLAIASRQYMVAFPLAVFLVEILRWRGELPRPRREWLAPAVAAASVLGWFAFFGGFAPPQAVQQQGLLTAQTLTVYPAHALYFLATVGAYFVVPEVVLFWRDNPVTGWVMSKSVAYFAAFLAMAFVIFPPLQNADYAIPTMGFLDRGARVILSTPLRLLLFYALALAACLRFRGPGLATWLVYANALMMLKAHIGWDKYVLPLLVVLWYLKATDRLSPAPRIAVAAHSGSP